jgi:hypothetical protein
MVDIAVKAGPTSTPFAFTRVTHFNRQAGLMAFDFLYTGLITYQYRNGFSNSTCTKQGKQGQRSTMARNHSSPLMTLVKWRMSSLAPLDKYAQMF